MRGAVRCWCLRWDKYVCWAVSSSGCELVVGVMVVLGVRYPWDSLQMRLLDYEATRLCGSHHGQLAWNAAAAGPESWTRQGCISWWDVA